MGNRDVITITFELAQGLEEELKVTSSHIMSVRRQGSGEFKPTPANELRKGDLLRTKNTVEAHITNIESKVESTKVLQVQLKDLKSTIYVAAAPYNTFIQVFGYLAPSGLDVKELTFRRCDDFRELFFESVELQGC